MACGCLHSGARGGGLNSSVFMKCQNWGNSSRMSCRSASTEKQQEVCGRGTVKRELIGRILQPSWWRWQHIVLLKVPYSSKFLWFEFHENVENHTNVNFFERKILWWQGEPTPTVAVTKTRNGMERDGMKRSIIFRLLTKSFNLGLGIPKSKFLGFGRVTVWLQGKNPEENGME